MVENHSYLQVIAHYYAKPENIKKVSCLLSKLATASRNEPENLFYDYYQSVNQPEYFVILEKYSSEHGLDKHRETSHFKDIGVAQIIPLLEKREVESYMVKNS